MRSTQIVLFLVIVNISAGIVAAGLPGDVSPTAGGDKEIEDSANDADDRGISRLPGTELVAGFFNAMKLIEDIRSIVFYGPEMLKNLGAPNLIMDGIELLLTLVVSFDVLEALTGRVLS